MRAAPTVWPRLDAALLSLRRLTNAPAARPQVTHGDRPIEFSTMLVVDAIARLSGPGEQHEVSVVSVASALQVTPSTASRLVERAVTSGMASRAASGVDPRRASLSLTADGHALHADAVAFRTGRLRALLEDWSDDDIATFTGLLERFADRVRTEPEHSHRQGDSS
jgi:DNA-binding MarR family transcriptional regulator